MTANKFLQTVVTAFALVGLTLGSSLAQAATIVQPTNADESTINGGRPGSQTIDGSGLSDATIVQTDDPIPATWPSHGTDSSSSMWVSSTSGGVSGQWLILDLGQAYELSGLHQWNFNEDGFTGVGIQNVNILFSSDSAAFSSASHSSWGDTFNTTFAEAPGSTGYTGETINFNDAIGNRTARYIQLDVVTNYGNSVAGLSEIRFIAVPEPSAFALLAGAFAFAWIMVRRRG